MKYLFADEAGNFDFSGKGSRFFIVTAVSMDDFQPGVSLLDLRHRLAHRQVELRHDGFHATDDRQVVRDEVFSLLAKLNFKVDAVVLDKSKAFPRLQSDEHYFYKMAWYLLFKHIVNRCFPGDEPGLVIAGSLGTKQKLKDFQNSISDVVYQYRHPGLVKAVAWSAASHPCLQIADYCCWAIQRSREQNDNRSYLLIESKIESCFSPW